jgi:hypothetical protein
MRRDPIKTVSFAANPHMEFLITQWNIGIYELYLNVNEGKKNAAKLVPGSTIAQQKMGSPSTFNVPWNEVASPPGLMTPWYVIAGIRQVSC